MDFFKFLSRTIRVVLSIFLLGFICISIFDSFSEVEAMEIAKKIKGEMSIEIDDIELKLAINDSTFLLKVEV